MLAGPLDAQSITTFQHLKELRAEELAAKNPFKEHAFGEGLNA